MFIAVATISCVGDDNGAGTGGETSTATSTATSTVTSPSTEATSESATSSSTGTTGSTTTGEPTTTGAATTGETTTSGSTGATTTGPPPDDIPAPWNEYCYVTFTEDTTDEFWGFTAKAGESYLPPRDLFSFESFFIFTDDGVFQRSMDLDFEQEDPFTTNCPDLKAAQEYLGIFEDLTIYTDPALTEVGCELTANTIVESVFSGGSSLYEQLDDGDIYEVNFPSLAGLCGGLEGGYVFRPTVIYQDIQTHTVAIRIILGPN